MIYRKFILVFDSIILRLFRHALLVCNVFKIFISFYCFFSISYENLYSGKDVAPPNVQFLLRPVRERPGQTIVGFSCLRPFDASVSVRLVP